MANKTKLKERARKAFVEFEADKDVDKLRAELREIEDELDTGAMSIRLNNSPTLYWIPELIQSFSDYNSEFVMGEIRESNERNNIQIY